jgi:nucleolar protein 56
VRRPTHTRAVRVSAVAAAPSHTFTLFHLRTSEGELTDYLRDFLELNIPKGGKESKISLGVVDSKIGSSIQ